MRRAEAQRQQHVEGAAYYFRGTVLKHAFCGLVEQQDAALFINGDDRVHGRGDDAGVAGFAAPQRLRPLFADDFPGAFDFPDQRLESRIQEQAAANTQHK